LIHNSKFDIIILTTLIASAELISVERTSLQATAMHWTDSVFT